MGRAWELLAGVAGLLAGVVAAVLAGLVALLVLGCLCMGERVSVMAECRGVPGSSGGSRG